MTSPLRTRRLAPVRATRNHCQPRASDDRPAARRSSSSRRLVRAALPTSDGYRVFANVRWLGRTQAHGQLSDGEADLVIAHPDRGFLVVEIKAGEIRRDAHGRWWPGRRVARARARSSRRSAASTRCSASSASCPIGPPTSTRSPATPSPCPMSTSPARAPDCGSLGPDIVPGPDPRPRRRSRRTTRRRPATPSIGALRPVGRRGRQAVARQAWPASTCSTDCSRRRRAAEPAAERDRRAASATVVELTDQPDRACSRGFDGSGGRRSSARRGTGKTLLAAEKAEPARPRGLRDAARLLQPAARAAAGGPDRGRPPRERGHLTVSTFHQLCEDLGREAGTLPPKPDPVPQAWFDGRLPRALDAAIEQLGARYPRDRHRRGPGLRRRTG